MEILSTDKSFEVKHGENVLAAVKISIPQAGGKSAEARRISAYYRAESRFWERYARGKFARLAKKQRDFMEKHGYIFNPFALEISFTVTLNDENTLSLYIDRREYAGGTNGVTVRRGDIWTGGFPLHMKIKGREKRGIRRGIAGEIERRRADGEPYFKFSKRLTRKYFSPKQVYLTSDGMTAFFQETTIAPHVSGITTFQIRKGERHAHQTTNETGPKHHGLHRNQAT